VLLNAVSRRSPGPAPCRVSQRTISPARPGARLHHDPAGHRGLSQSRTASPAARPLTRGAAARGRRVRVHHHGHPHAGRHGPVQAAAPRAVRRPAPAAPAARPGRLLSRAAAARAPPALHQQTCCQSRNCMNCAPRVDRTAARRQQGDCMSACLVCGHCLCAWPPMLITVLLVCLESCGARDSGVKQCARPLAVSGAPAANDALTRGMHACQAAAC